MQKPKPKKISSLAPGLLAESVRGTLLQLEDTLYDDPPPCPRCKSQERTRHDKKPRLLATLITLTTQEATDTEDREAGNGFHKVWVWVKRYVCKACRKVYYSRSPFYPGCVYGKPVVDICLFYAAHNPFCRVEHFLQQWGLQVDRDTIRNYVRRFGRRARNIAGVKIANSTVAINLVRLLFDAGDVEEFKERMIGEVFQDIADETYPAIKGAKKRLRDENWRRALKGEIPRKYPQSHTLASCYEARHKFFLSILVTVMAFNTMLADALCRPAHGCTAPVRDGSRCYRGEHIDGVNHKARRLIARDPVYRMLRREAKNTGRIDQIEQVKEYCLLFYDRVRREEEEKAVKAYPELVEEGHFVGALSTNSIEGGNWRIKFALKVPYKDPASLEARTLLIAISDSVKTFKAGKPGESFAHIHGCFDYSTVMAQTPRNRTEKNNQEKDLGPQTGNGDHGPLFKKRHTERYTVWLARAVNRATRKQQQKEVTTTTTN